MGVGEGALLGEAIGVAEGDALGVELGLGSAFAMVQGLLPKLGQVQLDSNLVWH